MTNDILLGQPDEITKEGRRLHRITLWLPLAYADDTQFGKVNNEEWLEREAARFRSKGTRCWIHHDKVTDTGALFSNSFFYTHTNE